MESLFVQAGRTSNASGEARQGSNELSAEVKTKLESSVGLGAYHRDDDLTSAILKHFRLNLNRMATIARDSDAEILYVVPADNLRDCTPFKSEPSRVTSQTEAADFDSMLEEAKDALYREHFELARELFSRAAQLDPRYAHARYGLGRALVELGRFEEARSELIAARDEDVCPLRALSAIPEIVREVAETQNAPVVDFPEVLFSTASQTRKASAAPGAEWFLDHVHPTVDGHRLLAGDLVQNLYELGWIPSNPTQRRSELDAMEEAVLAGLDPIEHGLALRNLAKVLSWAGKDEDAARAARKALTALGDDEESFFVLSEYASNRNDPESAVAYLREALRLDPGWVKARNNLGVQLMRLGRVTEALVEYDDVIRNAPEHVSALFNRANALKRLGRLEESINAYQACLRLEPEDLDALYNIAGALEEAGQPVRALGYLARLLELDPDDTDAKRRVARLSSLEPSQEQLAERQS
jgi:tetratricopeptide (TPR) repeat protein